MQDNTDNPAFPIIEYLNKQIKQEEYNRDWWALKLPTFTAQKLHSNAVQRIVAYKDVLEFIEETFKPE